jgi:HSP20 family protein
MVVIPISHSVATPLFSRSVGASLDALLGNGIRYARADSRSRRDQPQVPQMDVLESDTAYTVILNAPGVAREELKVSVQGRRVEIEAQSAAPAALPEGQRSVYSERPSARYARTIALPAEVDSASSQAKLENGVLTLTLNKKVATGATQLAIN